MNILLDNANYSEKNRFISVFSDAEIDLDQEENVNPIEELESLMGPELEALILKKVDGDEKIVRKALVKVWTKILEKYARKGAHIPPADVVYKELLEKGVNAAVDAVVDAHWFVFTFMIREKIETNVRKGLDAIDLPAFIQEVKEAQNNPAILNKLREEIKRCVLF
jgi:hypothetical protein